MNESCTIATWAAEDGQSSEWAHGMFWCQECDGGAA